MRLSKHLVYENNRKIIRNRILYLIIFFHQKLEKLSIQIKIFKINNTI